MEKSEEETHFDSKWKKKAQAAASRRARVFVSAAVSASAAKIAMKAVAASMSACAATEKILASPQGKKRYTRPWAGRPRQKPRSAFQSKGGKSSHTALKETAKSETSVHDKRRRLYCLASRYSAVMKIVALQLNLCLRRQKSLQISNLRHGDIVVVKGESQLLSHLQASPPPSTFFIRMMGAKQICTKVALATQLKRVQRLLPADEARSAFWPQTWVLPDAIQNSSTALQKEMGKQTSGSRSNYFVAKPDGGSQGDGIFLVQSFDELCMRLRCIVAGRSSEQKWVLQRYIPQPHLIDGFKWDMRVYVAVTKLEPLFSARTL